MPTETKSLDEKVQELTCEIQRTQPEVRLQTANAHAEGLEVRVLTLVGADVNLTPLLNDAHLKSNLGLMVVHLSTRRSGPNVVATCRLRHAIN